MLKQTFPSPEALRRSPFTLADVAVMLGTLVLLGATAWVGRGAFTEFYPTQPLPGINLDPRNLPYYATRSTLRMFVAMFFSTVFTLIYGRVAAQSRWAEKIMVPLLDILQSVPVLGFLSITVTGFIALFPGSLLGLEAASIFAIFTGQVWNMTFSFYHSLRTIPGELDEATKVYRLSGWEKFTKLEVPVAMIGLLWNAMMSFGGGWFFVTQSEAITVLNNEFILPGLGSYVAAAIAAEDLTALGWALVAIAVVIVLCDQLFWRPLVAWADKFRMEQSASSDAPKSWLYDLLIKARIPSLISRAAAPATDGLNRSLAQVSAAHPNQAVALPSARQERSFNLVLQILIGLFAILGLHFILSTVGLPEVFKVFGLGLLTLLRVIVLMIVSTLIWTPLGVAIGFNLKLARFLQPLVQFLAAFPANFIFPFATLFFLRTNISIEIGSILLMALGAQWYILFNSIAGAMMIPTELREMATSFNLKGWQLWRQVIIPGIFSAWVTGGITASGGAWNASIVAEIVTWGDSTLTATGLGAYIESATRLGDWPRIALGIGMMSLFVVGLNRIFWRRLYELAETKYHL